MTVPDTMLSIRSHAVAGALVAGLGIGGFGAFASVIEMPAAVVAGGTIQPDTHRKTVQHLEGGIIDRILVRDGDRVRAGDPLMQLDTTRIRASLAALEADMGKQRAREARFAAELGLAEQVTFRPENALTDQARQFVASERQLFHARLTAHRGQTALLEARAEQLAESLAGITAQRDAAQSQLDGRRLERNAMEALVTKGAVPKSRLDDLDREIDRLLGVAGNANAQIAVNRAAQAEAQLQIVQLRNTYQQTASDGLAEVVGRISELAERIRIATDTLQRSVITAPIDGTVQELKVFTHGGVISPAQPLLDIVPFSDRIVIEARIPVTEIDDLVVGQTAELRFPSFHGRDLPEIRGMVARLSVDAITENNVSFYKAGVDVDGASLPARIAKSLQPGMPADIVVVTRHRSLMDYLLEPVREMMRGSMRES
jgi:HlyD family secretion protein